MEIANDEMKSNAASNRVRVANRRDIHLISKLIQNAPFSHVHADWHYPVDWLGSPGFVVLEYSTAAADSDSMTGRFFGNEPRLLACLAVAADPPPASWVRVAAVSEKIDGAQALPMMSQLIDESLRKTEIKQIGWLQIESWPQSWIRASGFDNANYMETYVKEGMEIPYIKQDQRMKFRPVKTADLERLAEIEAAAYEPLWRSSVTGLVLARRHAFSFDVVEYEDEVVGYQYSTMMAKKAHLSRITLHPQWQGKGIGSALLAHAIDGYRQKGVDKVSLNTQLDNLKSKRLYERFDFRPTGERFPIWVKYLQAR